MNTTLSTWHYLLVTLLLIACSDNRDLVTADQSVNGSTSRFAINGNYMYALEISRLKIFDISDLSNPNLKREISIDAYLETIFSHKNKLYIGAREGIFVVNIDDPVKAFLEHTIRHWIARDPVIVREPYIYSTTHNAFSGVFNVYKQTDRNNFITVFSDVLSQPLGLDAAKKHLYICDIQDGMVVYNIENPENPLKLNAFPEFVKPLDVIVIGEAMLVAAEKLFYLADLTNESKPRIIKVIK